MAGDIIALNQTKSESDRVIGIGGSPSTDIIGERSSIFFNETINGVPRNDDLFAVRVLGQTTQIQWLKDIIKNQVASTDYHVKPVTEEDEEPDPEQVEAAKQVEEFFSGNFNTDPMSFDDLITIILDDLLDFDSGILELVGNENGDLEQIIPRDGLTFTKNLTDAGLLPSEDSEQPAYYQFSLASHVKNMFNRHQQGIDIRDLQDQLHSLPFTKLFSRETKEFSRSQIVWFENSPVSYQAYGFGKTQKVKNAAEIMINGDTHRNRFFLDNEFHKGMLAVDSSMNQDDKKALKRRFKDSAGNEHELPVVGTADNVEYVSIDPEPEKMQFLESQKWYTRLVINAYGLNDVEAGFLENANKGISDDAKRKIFRQTTEPLLTMIERRINNEILPKMSEYKAVDGDLQFEFKPQNKFMESIQNSIIEQELQNGTITLNEARERKGKEPFGDIGDAPQTAFEEYARNNPSYVIEQLTDLEDVPSGDGGSGGGLFASHEDDDDSEDGVGKDEGGTGTPSTINDYRDAFQYKEKVLQDTKDALRNQRGFNDVPGIVEHKNELKQQVVDVFSSININQELEENFPDESQENGILVNADDIVENISFRDRLASILESNNLEALEMSAEHHEQEVEQEAEEKLALPEEAKLEISFDIFDTFTADMIRQEAVQSATTIEDTIKDRLKNTILEGASKGEGIPKIKDRVKKTVDSISDSNAELVARTETLQSSRKGSQALAESTDLVEGKEWLATDDARTRKWHDAMDGTIVPKDNLFTVPNVGSDDQPNDYPRSVRVVGEDQPYNCRCSQAPVLNEDMPDDPRTLSKDYDNVELDLDITERQFEIWMKHGKDYNNFHEFWKKVTEEKSKSEIAEEFGMSKTTVYKWTE
ncbi:MAG: phage portal protein [Candidatus Nanohaloarchaea archaeon]